MSQNGSDLFKRLMEHSSGLAWRKAELVDGRSIIAPATWSDLAVQMADRFYLRRRVQANGAVLVEQSIQELLARVATECALAVQRFHSPSGMSGVTQDEEFALEPSARAMFQLLYDQKLAFNSPVWMNLGLMHTVAVEDRGEARSEKTEQRPSNHFAWNDLSESVEASGDLIQRPQLSACFIQSVQDDLGSIFSVLEAESRIFKFGSGSGSNFSRIRSKGEPLSSGGESPGVLRFLEVFDRAAAAMKSGGSTRRAAKMVVLDCDHPDIFEFIDWKRTEELKAKALVQAGYSDGLEGEAYRTVSGQNSNNSVRLTDALMRAAENKQPFHLLRRTDGTISRTVDANSLLDAIAQAAWECADPGLQFADTIERSNPVKAQEPIRGSNPCAEFVFVDDTACNLASLNLTRFVDEQAFRCDHEGLAQAIQTLVQTQDAFVDLASYPTVEIARKSHSYRPIGVGFTNLGALLMRLGIPYESELGQVLCGAITSFVASHAHVASAMLARKLGPFEHFKKNRASVMGVLKARRRAHDDLYVQANQQTANPALMVMIRQLLESSSSAWKLAEQEISVVGLRNAQLTLLAPTGTISFLMDAETTGIEPEFDLVKYKALSGGGTLRLVSESFLIALRGLKVSEPALGLMRSQLESGASFDLCLERLRESGFRSESEVLDHHRAVFRCAREITPKGHLQMMAASQPFLCGAISKTINLKASTQVAELKDLIFMSWRMGLKSVAFYRDGSKLNQPLTAASGADCSGCAVS